MFLHHVQFLFHDLVGDVEREAAAMRARFRLEGVLLDFEMGWKPLATGRGRARCIGFYRAWLRGRLGSLVERGLRRSGQARWWRRRLRTCRLALSTLRDGEQLGNAFVESRELLGERRIRGLPRHEKRAELAVLFFGLFRRISGLRIV